MLSEIVDNIIPHQRFDRLIRYCHALDVKIGKYEAWVSQIKLDREEVIALIKDVEDGFIHGAG